MHIVLEKRRRKHIIMSLNILAIVYFQMSAKYIIAYCPNFVTCHLSRSRSVSCRHFKKSTLFLKHAITYGYICNFSNNNDDDVQQQKGCVSCLVNSSVLLDLFNLSLDVVHMLGIRLSLKGV